MVVHIVGDFGVRVVVVVAGGGDGGKSHGRITPRRFCTKRSGRVALSPKLCRWRHRCDVRNDPGRRYCNVGSATNTRCGESVITNSTTVIILVLIFIIINITTVGVTPGRSIVPVQSHWFVCGCNERSEQIVRRCGRSGWLVGH